MKQKGCFFVDRRSLLFPTEMTTLKLKVEKNSIQFSFSYLIPCLLCIWCDPLSRLKNRLSGGDDDAHGNQTVMETTFEEGGAGWEITRYAGVLHGFTNFESADAYNLVADARSWESMRSAFAELMAVPQKADAGNDTSPPADTTSDNGDSSANAHRQLAGVVAVAAFALVFVGGVV